MTSLDLKLGVRMLGKTPGITIVAVIALAVGIAAGASYLEFINSFFRGKPSFPGGDRLVGILNWDLKKGDVEDKSLYEFAAWKTQLTKVEELGAAREFEETFVAADGSGHTAFGAEISASAFRVVPIRPRYGRPLLDHDEGVGAPDVVVIGEALWISHFDSDPRIVGRTVQFGETHRTVVGIMPRGFGFPGSSSFWTPLRFRAAAVKRAEGPRIRIFGRLATGATLEQARAELETIASRMEERRANSASMAVSIHPFVESFWADFSRSRSGANPVVLLLYSFNIFFVALLGICAANVAQLIFARTATRETEITIRTALGASRRRIIGQLIAEALVLSSVAGVAGLAGAAAILRKLSEILEMTTGRPLPFWWNDRIGIETLVYSVVLVVLTSLVIGGVPALKATGQRMNARLQEAGAGGATMKFGKLWTGVMVTQVAVTVVFLVVLVSSGWAAYLQNRRAAVAFPRKEYLLASIQFEEGATAERQRMIRRELQRRLNESAGVLHSTFARHLPGEDDGDEFRIEFPSPEGRASGGEGPGEAVMVQTMPVGSGYFETFQQPLVAGRPFTAAEMDEGRNVAIVDDTFVRLVLGGRNAIGQLVRETRSEQKSEPGPWLEIVGVVKDVTVATDKTAADTRVYRPAPLDGHLFVHSRNHDAVAKLRETVSATDGGLRLMKVTTIEQRVVTDAEMAGIAIKALGAIAAITLILAAAGIHSLISFTLASRTREMGIRSALGAAPLRIVRGVLSPAFLKVGAGIVLGCFAGTALVQATLSWGIEFRVLLAAAAGVAVFIVVVVGASCIWPVRRALRIQPTEALRTT